MAARRSVAAANLFVLLCPLLLQASLAEEETEPGTAVLFPWFAEVVGVVVFYLLSRRFHSLPYTAVMFLVGTLMGIGATRAGFDDQLTKSILQWIEINSEVLLLVFLPGLLFRDAFDVNFHLFQKALPQLLIMAFLMVLAGTALTALVGKYVLPYKWSFDLAMTFGSILSATDPVAVSALLNEVGAPPRLKMHISGESMLNDGSAVVFFTIFSERYFYELGIPGFGENVDVGEGFKIFFRMALGGASVGVAFGLALILVLNLLNRRLETEENVVQVAATVTMAYLSFFTAEVSCKMSGVISVVMCGITTSAWGNSMINDHEMMESFWILLEQLLNTALFALGGVVWGAVIANGDEREGLWQARDWGYLILLYILVQAIRFFLVFSFYPINSRIGLKSNWQESMFIFYAGLRGAVGIALAIALDNEVWAETAEDPDEGADAREDTTKLFGMVGGVAFFTLVINGTTSGPLLKKLGLAKSSQQRLRVVEWLRGRIKLHVLDKFVYLLTFPHYSDVDFAIVRHHVPMLDDLTVEKLNAAVQQNKEHVPASEYLEPRLSHLLPYLTEGDTSLTSKEDTDDVAFGTSPDPVPEPATRQVHSSLAEKISMLVGTPADTISTPQEAMEARLVFIELLRAVYMQLIERGVLDSREGDGFLVYALLQSLEFAADDVHNGKPLNDWEAERMMSNEFVSFTKTLPRRTIEKNKVGADAGEAVVRSAWWRERRLDIVRQLFFIIAHQEAQKRFFVEFCDSVEEVTAAAKLVLSESKAQERLAEELVESQDQKEVDAIVSHLLCLSLLNSAARNVEHFSTNGLLKKREARAFLEEIEEAISGISHCALAKHPGRLSKDNESGFAGSKKF